MIDPDRALDYLDFVRARHDVWEARQVGAPQPWTEDPIVAARKFTNVFRILDPGTQIILTDLVDPSLSTRDQLARLFLYRHTGVLDLWRYLGEVLPGGVRGDNLGDVEKAIKAYRGPLDRPDRPVFTSAYLVFPGLTDSRGSDKVETIIERARGLFDDSRESYIIPDFEAAETQAERFRTMRRNRGVGDFMSMQVLTDWGYTPQAGEDREDEFVVLGPGARKGARVLDAGSKPEATLEWAYRSIREMEEPPTIPLPGGGNRLPSRMDIQNTLCEFFKYSRYQGRPLSAKPYRPLNPGQQDPPVFPKHW